MKDEFDLEALWNTEQPQADAYFQQAVSPKLAALAQRQSGQALAKLRRIMIWEWVVGILALLFLFWVYRHHWFVGWMALGSGLYLLISIPPYWAAWRSIQRIPTHNVRESLTAYRQVIQRYLWRVRGYVWVATLSGFVLGAYWGASESASGPLPLKAWAIFLLIGMVFTVAMDWTLRKGYFKYTYYPILTQLQELDDQLDQQ